MFGKPSPLLYLTAKLTFIMNNLTQLLTSTLGRFLEKLNNTMTFKIKLFQLPFWPKTK